MNNLFTTLSISDFVVSFLHRGEPQQAGNNSLPSYIVIGQGVYIEILIDVALNPNYLIAQMFFSQFDN